MQPNLTKLKALAPKLDDNLQGEWREFRAAYDEQNATAIQLGAVTIILKLRLKAVAQYFLDADRQGFFEKCYQSALTYDLTNTLIKSGMPHDPNIYSLTEARGFFSALLTLPLSDVARVINAMPKEMQGQDDRTQFWFVAFLMQTVTGKRAAAEKSLDALRERSARKEVGIELGFCESLRDKDGPRFVESMKAFLDRRLHQIEINDDSVDPGEEYVSIEGLALRRLAANVGLEVQIRHPLTPIELQENYPDPKTFSRGDVPEPPAEIERAGFWKGWAEVESW